MSQLVVDKIDILVSMYGIIEQNVGSSDLESHLEDRKTSVLSDQVSAERHVFKW